MKNKLIGILAMATLVLAIVTSLQSRRLSALREELLAEQKSREAAGEAIETQAAQVTKLERSNRQLEEQARQLAETTSSLRSAEGRPTLPPASLVPPLPGAQKSKTGEAGDSEGASNPFGKGMGAMIGKMMKDPAMREMIRDQQKASINMMYSGLFKDLNLAPDEKERLRTLLTDAQVGNIDLAQGMFGDKKEGAMAEAAAKIAEAKKVSDQEIHGLLGDERYAQYEEYQKNMAERMQIDQFKNQLSEDSALTDDQAKQLMQLMQTQKAALPPAIPSNPGQVQTPDAFTAESLDKQVKWMEEYNRRVLDGAAQILSPDQLKQYQSFQDQQASMQKLGLQMAKGMFGGDKGGPAPGAEPAGAPAK